MQERPSRRERALSLLAGKAAEGAAFFDVAVEALTEGLGYRWGGVGRLSADRRKIKVLALTDHGRRLPPVKVDFAGSPCEALCALSPRETHLFVPQDLTELFGAPPELMALGPVCYRGELFFGPDGEPAGHVFAMDDRADREDSASRAFFRLVSQRVGAEYNRWRAETALRDSEARTRAAEQRLRDAIQSISDGFALYDSEDRLVAFNSQWASLYGYDEKQALPGVRYEDLVRFDVENGAVEGDAELYIRQRLAYRRQFRGSFDLQLKDGRWITIREAATADGGIVGIQSDITDRMEAIESLLGEKTEADRANKAKSDFVAKLSHELRTPLNAIAGFAEFISEARLGPVGNPKYREYAADILGASHHLLDLVNDLLDIAKMESGIEDLQEQSLDVGETVRAVLVFTRDMAAEKGVSIELYLDNALPKLRADPRKLKQILINIVANAVKYTDSGGRVMVAGRSGADGEVVFEVADTGEGIPQAQIEEALTEYRRVGSARSLAEEGTGLGLPLAAALAELHGGALEVDSVPGFGTLVTVTFPRQRARHLPAKRPAAM